MTQEMLDEFVAKLDMFEQRLNAIAIALVNLNRTGQSDPIGDGRDIPNICKPVCSKCGEEIIGSYNRHAVIGSDGSYQFQHMGCYINTKINRKIDSDSDGVGTVSLSDR